MKQLLQFPTMLSPKFLRIGQKVLIPSNLQRTITRNDSSKVPGSPRLLEHLKTRSLLSIKGAESSEFLQGLITNDMNHFTQGIPNIYSLFLNTKGRVLYDTIIYKSPEENAFLLEIDSSVINEVQKHLKIYKIRRKIEITPLKEEMKVWASFEANFDVENLENSKIDGKIFPCGSLTNESTKLIDEIMIFKDPRIPNFGLRILSSDKISEDEISKKLGVEMIRNEERISYKEFRYRLGIGEGSEDLPPGKPLPLEVNCDYLHGVSFHKGCYIGQELTARTHHTGVVRKRLMPLIFDKIPEKSLDYDENIVNEEGKPVGKFRGIQGKYALGLMRISEAVSAKSLKIGVQDVRVVKPCWWPVDSSKERISVN